MSPTSRILLRSASSEPPGKWPWASSEYPAGRSNAASSESSPLSCDELACLPTPVSDRRLVSTTPDRWWPRSYCKWSIPLESLPDRHGKRNRLLLPFDELLDGQAVTFMHDLLLLCLALLHRVLLLLLFLRRLLKSLLQPQSFDIYRFQSEVLYSNRKHSHHFTNNPCTDYHS